MLYTNVSKGQITQNISFWSKKDIVICYLCGWQDKVKNHILLACESLHTYGINHLDVNMWSILGSLRRCSLTGERNTQGKIKFCMRQLICLSSTRNNGRQGMWEFSRSTKNNGILCKSITNIVEWRINVPYIKKVLEFDAYIVKTSIWLTTFLLFLTFVLFLHFDE